MISLTRLDGRGIIIHATHIVTVESTPNTLLALHNGGRLMVRESAEEVCNLVGAWSRRVACSLPAVSPSPPSDPDEEN